MQKPESCDEGYSSACSQYTLPACLKSTVLVQTAANQIIHTVRENSSFYPPIQVIAKYGNICYDKPSSGSAHPAAPELRRQTDSDMRTARPPVFRVLLVPGADTHFFYPFTFWFSGPYRAANPKGIKTKAYNYKTAGFLCSAIVWPPQKNYNKSSSP